jgi:hypothetical protein
MLRVKELRGVTAIGLAPSFFHDLIDTGVMFMIDLLVMFVRLK